MRKNLVSNILLKAVPGILLAVLTCTTAAGQNEVATQSDSIDPTIVSVPTPQAASIGKFGRVPVDLYNGLYSLSLPIYSLPVRGLPVDIRLSYHSGGVKPSEKGGVLGVGWSLIAGGNITRVQHGTLDEHVNRNYSDSLLGYYWNHSQLSMSNWDSASTVLNFLTQIICQGSPPGCPVGVTQWHDWAPDEFMFNVAGYSGSFWLDTAGHWVVRESGGEKMNASVDFGYYSYKDSSATDSVRLSYCFRKFTLKDGNGNSFIFGGDPNSLEFNRNINDQTPATATSWWLTQIVTNKAEKVNFSYKRVLPSISVFGGFNAYQAQVGSNSYAQYNLQTVTGMLHDPVYLQSISYNNLSIQFTYGVSNIFTYSRQPALNPNGGVYPDNVSHYLSGNPSTWPSQELNAVYTTDYKLTGIAVNYNGYGSKQYGFTYYDSTLSNRLFLKSYSIGPPTRALVYQFAYNGMNFYNYADSAMYDGLLTTKIDHWGFYNGKFPFKTIDLPQSFGRYLGSANAYPSPDFISNYYTNRAPNADSMKIGSLATITYPTGGYTNFIYEPNDYSSQLSLSNNQAAPLGSNSTGGGLRIKEIDSYTDPYRPPLVKKYLYKNDNGLSSGVLNSAGISYNDSLTGTLTNGQQVVYKFFSDNNILPLQNTNGNSVTYSRVDEINGDSGRNVYRYTNYDNGHYDLMPSNFISAFANAKYWRQNDSRSFQRGKPMSQLMLDSSKNSVSRDSTQYLNDDSLTTRQIGVRAYDMKAREIKMISYAYGQGILTAIFQTATLYTPSVSPFVYYAHNYPEVKRTTTYYKGSDSIQTVETWHYDSSNNKVSVDSLENLSDGSMKIITSTYPADYLGNSFYYVMDTLRLVDPLIQQTTTNQSAKLLHVSKDSLVKNSLSSGNYYWLYVKDQYQDPTDTVKENIYKYDSIGNPIDVKGADGIPLTYLWDYSSMHPVAITKNAASSSVAYTSFEAEGTGNWTVPDGTRNPGGITGGLSYNITNTKTISATVTSGQTYTLSYWAQNGPAVVKANGTTISLGFTGLTKSGWTYYEYTLPSTTTAASVTGASSSSTPIDELRLYPSTAQMTTYTYLPLTGVASVCSPANSVANYVWDDAMDRLLRIQDMDGNIVKQYEYHYNEYAKPFYNLEKDSSFTRGNCAPGGTPSTVVYTVPANRYSSTISQQDAYNQALADVIANGQHYADSVGTCTFSNDMEVMRFQRSNCAPGGTGTLVWDTVPAGIYHSIVSQYNADSIALAYLTANGPNYANLVGQCAFQNHMETGTFTKSCGTGGIGSNVIDTIPAGTYTSYISQGNADTLALNALATYGPLHADSLGTCTYWNIALGKYYSRNNCSPGYTGMAVWFPIAANLFSSNISQGNADTLALNWADSGPGQDTANAEGQCLIAVYCNNYVGVSGFTATYTNIKTHAQYSFTIPSTSGVIGYMISGPMTLTISKPGNTTIYGFNDGCGITVTDGTSASFSGVNVQTTTCNTLTINNPQ